MKKLKKQFLLYISFSVLRADAPFIKQGSGHYIYIPDNTADARIGFLTDAGEMALSEANVNSICTTGTDFLIFGKKIGPTGLGDLLPCLSRFSAYRFFGTYFRVVISTPHAGKILGHLPEPGYYCLLNKGLFNTI